MAELKKWRVVITDDGTSLSVSVVGITSTSQATAIRHAIEQTLEAFRPKGQKAIDEE